MRKSKKRLTKKQIKELAEALKYSRVLYARREGDHPAVKSALEFFQSELVKEYMVRRYKSKYRNAVRIFILDLFFEYQIDPERYLAYSRSRDDYKKTGRFGKLHLSCEVTKKVIDYLIRYEYIEHHKGVYDKITKEGKRSRIRATEKLIRVLSEEYKVEIGQYCWERDANSNTVKLRDANKEKINYEDTKDTLQLKGNLKVINRALERNAVFLYIKDTEYRDLFKRMQKHSNNAATDFTRKYVRRIYNNSSWKQGGRFYEGWWQNIPKEYRQYIRINDKDVVECDYSGLHINMLYAMEGLPMPNGDVYRDIPGYPNSDNFRTFVKQLLLILVNADNRIKAREAIQDTVYHKKRLKLPKEIIPSTEGKHIFSLIDAFSEKHKHISKYFCTGAGIDLQNKDAQIAEQVMLHFAKWNYAILVMHDSFIIHHGLEQELKDCMNEAFRDMFNTDIKVDLKYNSITERQKIGPENTGPCKMRLTEIFEDRKTHSIYYKLLEQFKKYNKGNILM